MTSLPSQLVYKIDPFMHLMVTIFGFTTIVFCLGDDFLFCSLPGRTTMGLLWRAYYRSGTVNSKSFVGKVLLRIKWKFELTYAL